MIDHVKYLFHQLLLVVVLLIPGVMTAQTITGTVTDTDGTPLIGSSIVEEGTSSGTVTDLDGKFSLAVSDPEVKLRISYTGYESQTIALNGRTSLDVVLEVDAETLEEVVVIGYGTVKKSDLTGSVSKIKSEDFNAGAIVSADQALQGRIAGVNKIGRAHV